MKLLVNILLYKYFGKIKMCLFDIINFIMSLKKLKSDIWNMVKKVGAVYGLFDNNRFQIEKVSLPINRILLRLTKRERL